MCVCVWGGGSETQRFYITFEAVFVIFRTVFRTPLSLWKVAGIPF